MNTVGLIPGTDYLRRVAYYYEAHWSCKDVQPSADPEAKPFGPLPFPQRQRQILSVAKLGIVRGVPPSTKPVLYMPVMRRAGKDTNPTLVLQIRLIDANSSQSHPVPAWVGTSVNVEVVNVLRSNKSDHKLTLTGTLDKNLICTIEVPPDTIDRWLHGSPLGARINENLLDFRFEMPGVKDGEAALVGQSANRVFLYCRKTVVFLPGLFGSQVQFTDPTGEIYGFPDFYREPMLEAAPLPGDGGPPAILPDLLPESQNAAVLECDDEGIPLVPCKEPKLLMLSGLRWLFGSNVTDPFRQVHRARMDLLSPVPEKFRLYTLIIYPYDWRLDLTKAATDFIAQLKTWQSKAPTALWKQPDTDDRFFPIGHSTGGVIIRRALGVKDAEKLISHAFYLSVPLSGAPKAGAVLLTGREVPFGKAQIPFIAPNTLKSIALSMPIVYHLHTSEAYGYRPATSPSRPPRGETPSATWDIAADKKSCVEVAIESGFYSQPRLVTAAGARDPAVRKQLALTSREWNELLDEYNARIGGSIFKHAIAEFGSHDRWFEQEVLRRGLELHREKRRTMGWSDRLAQNARTFHDESRKGMESGTWKEKTFLFWGSCRKSPTLRQLNFSRLGTHVYPDVMTFLAENHIPAGQLSSVGAGMNLNHAEVFSELPGEGINSFSGGKYDYRTWKYNGREVHESRWRLQWILQLNAGDGTVPSDSQLAEAEHVAAVMSTRSPDDPDDWPQHMDSTKSQYVWDSLVRIVHCDGKIADSGVRHDTNLSKAGSRVVPKPMQTWPKHHEWLRFHGDTR